MTAGVMCPLTLPICLYRTKMFHYQHTMKLLVQFPALKAFPVVQYYCVFQMRVISDGLLIHEHSSILLWVHVLR